MPKVRVRGKQMNENTNVLDGVKEMLTTEQVLTMIPVSRQTLKRMEKDKLFPQGKPLTPYRRLYFRDEVVQWQRDLQDPNSELSRNMNERRKKADKGRHDDD
jgi:prophage regulatory protein